MNVCSMNVWELTHIAIQRRQPEHFIGSSNRLMLGLQNFSYVISNLSELSESTFLKIYKLICCRLLNFLSQSFLYFLDISNQLRAIYFSYTFHAENSLEETECICRSFEMLQSSLLIKHPTKIAPQLSEQFKLDFSEINGRRPNHFSKLGLLFVVSELGHGVGLGNGRYLWELFSMFYRGILDFGLPMKRDQFRSFWETSNR